MHIYTSSQCCNCCTINSGSTQHRACKPRQQRRRRPRTAHPAVAWQGGRGRWQCVLSWRAPCWGCCPSRGEWVEVRELGGVDCLRGGEKARRAVGTAPSAGQDGSCRVRSKPTLAGPPPGRRPERRPPAAQSLWGLETSRAAGRERGWNGGAEHGLVCSSVQRSAHG